LILVSGQKEKNMLRLRVAAVIAGIFLASVFSLPSLADSVPTLSINPVSSSASAGSSLVLDVNISNITNLYGFQFDLSFAPGTLSAISITEGSLLTAGGFTFFLPGSIDNTAGTIAFTANSLLGPGPGVDGSGTLAILTLSALAAGTSSIELSNVFLLDSNLNPIKFSLQNGSVTVTTGSVATPEPNSLVLLIAGIAIALFSRRVVSPGRL
jgi:hypothetical protein